MQPVPDGDGVVELDGDPGQQVAQSILHGEGDDRGDHRRGGDYLPERHAGGVEAKQTPADIADGDDDVGDDPRDADLAEGQKKFEQQYPPHFYQYQARQQGGDLDQQLMGQRQFEPAPFQLDQQDHDSAYHHEAELGEQLPSLPGRRQKWSSIRESVSRVQNGCSRIHISVGSAVRLSLNMTAPCDGFISSIAVPARGNGALGQQFIYPVQNRAKECD